MPEKKLKAVINYKIKINFDDKYLINLCITFVNSAHILVLFF